MRDERTVVSGQQGTQARRLWGLTSQNGQDVVIQVFQNFLTPGTAVSASTRVSTMVRGCDRLPSTSLLIGAKIHQLMVSLSKE